MTKDQEDFDKTRKRLYAIADRMGMKLTIVLRRKKQDGVPNAYDPSGRPVASDASRTREPGDD